MNTAEYNLIIDMIKKILKNLPVEENDNISDSEEMDRIQQALVYLSSCLKEADRFSGDLCRGDLETSQPSRHNYLAGGLKELHAVLRHLTWQTKQVANGDYQQRVSFLGDFSDSFNIMVQQLDEREKTLRERTKALQQSMSLITTLMDVHKDWIVVARAVDGMVVYNNRPDKLPMHIYSTSRMGLTEVPLESRDGSIAPLAATLYVEESSASYYAVHDYAMIWDDYEVVVHYITNVTEEQKVKRNLSEMAFTDQLTGVYNRRYCMLELDSLLKEGMTFSYVLIDLNELKYVNDNLGHDEGDAYIKFAVEQMIRLTRDDDVICRIGGDEFVLLLKNCDGHSADKKMTQIFNAINNEVEKKYRRSISYGITYVDASKTYTIETLMTESDKKMYSFKQEYKKNRGIS